MACKVCDGTGVLLQDVCPLCDGLAAEQEAAAVVRSCPEVFRGAYLTVEVPGGGEETYLELLPPALREADPGAAPASRALDAYMVLDCSGSMSGRRMRAANAALQSLYASPRVQSLTVLRFGSRTAPAAVFRKCETGELPAFQADLGATKFVPALQELGLALERRVRELQGVAEAPQQLAVFVSDGACHDNPREAISGLAELLRRADCPLMSVAITTEVRPDVMVALADMHGDLPLLLVRDSEAEETLADQLLEHLPLDGSQETLRVSFLRADTGEAVACQDRRFARDGGAVELVAPGGVRFADLTVTVSLVADGCLVPAELKLQHVGGAADEEQEGDGADEGGVLGIAEYGRALLCIARGIVGAFIKGELPREKAEEQVAGLRAAFASQLSADDLEKTRARVVAGSTAGAREQRAKLVGMLRARRAAAMDVQQQFNVVLETVGRNDMREALAAYSKQTIAAKCNRRLAQVARRNAARAGEAVAEEAALRVLRSFEDSGDAGREMAPCLLWLCNPYEAMAGFAQADQGDWVGRAVLVVPGRAAALNCWRLERVLVRPLSITRSVIPQVRVDEADGQRRAVVSGTGYPEFNACLPMIAPGEHVGAVRLAIHCMRHSSAGRAALADLVCGSAELYDPAMVNAAYVAAVLSSLALASTEADLDGALRALLTALDLAGSEGAVGYWGGIFARLAGPDAAKLVACKDPDAMPDVARAFLPVVCSDAAYAASEEVVRAVCAKLLLRTALDQASGQLRLHAAVGIDEAALKARCEAHAAQACDGELEAVMQDPAAAAAAAEALAPPANTCGFRLRVSHVALTHGLHLALRRAELPRPSRLIEAVMTGAVPGAAVLDALRAGRVGSDPIALAAQLFGAEDGAKAFADLLTVCCHGQAPGATDLPRHDGKYVAACLESLERCGGVTAQGLRVLAGEIRQRALAAAYRGAVERVHFERHKLEIVRAFARRAERFLEEHPWEAHRHEMPQLTLGFTTDQRRFGTRDELWASLQDGWYHAEDLRELRELTPESVKDFDLAAWQASHRHFLPGYHIYSGKNLAMSRGDLSSYLARMRKDLDDHYAGRNNKLYRREFTPKMQAWVEPYARLVFQEARLAAALEQACADPAGPAEPAELAEEVWAQFPEIKSLQPERREARRRHVQLLAAEALARAGRPA